MNNNNQSLIDDIESAQKELQDNLQKIYEALSPKNILEKVSTSVKTVVSSPAFLAGAGALLTAILGLFIFKKKRNKKLVQKHLLAQKTLEAYQELQNKLSQ